MRTKVARRLASLQWRTELEIVVGTLVFCALTTGFFVIGFFVGFERIRPLGWPNFREDSAKWVAPASCSPELCNATKGPGHHSIYTDVECLDGEVVDKSETNCFGPWSFTSGTLASLMCLVLLGCIICSCTFARRWGQRASAGGSARITPAHPQPMAVAQQRSAPPGTLMVSTQCPAGSRAGDTIQVTHGGVSYDCMVPNGVEPGQTFQVAVPAPVA